MAFVRRCLNINRKRWVVQQTSLSTLTKAHLGKWGRSVVWEVDANDNNLELTSDRLRPLAVEQAGSSEHM